MAISDIVKGIPLPVILFVCTFAAFTVYIVSTNLAIGLVISAAVTLAYVLVNKGHIFTQSIPAKSKAPLPDLTSITSITSQAQAIISSLQTSISSYSPTVVAGLKSLLDWTKNL